MENEISRILRASNHYEVLGVSRCCDHSQIKTAYRKLATKVHPDRCKDQKATEAFQKISHAYQVLSDENLRRKYDTFDKEEDYFREETTRYRGYRNAYQNNAQQCGNVRYVFTDGRGHYWSVHGNPFQQYAGQNMRYFFTKLDENNEIVMKQLIHFLLAILTIAIIGIALFCYRLLKANAMPSKKTIAKELRKNIVFLPSSNTAKNSPIHFYYNSMKYDKKFQIPKSWVRNILPAKRMKDPTFVSIIRKEADSIYEDWIRKKCSEEVDRDVYGDNCKEMVGHKISF